MQGGKLIDQRIAGGRLVSTLLLYQTIQADACCQRNGDGNRAQREAGLLLPFSSQRFSQSSLAVALSPQSPGLFNHGGGFFVFRHYGFPI